jgi:hypothetical protein
VDEDRFQARDAHDSTILLTLIVLAYLGISVVTQRAAGLGRLVESLRLGHLALTLGALVFLLRTRRHPREGAALAVWLLIVIPALPMGVVSALRWHELGRPWEAFPALHLVLISLALITPGSFWLGIVFVAAFTAEAIGLTIWLRRADPGRFPHLEPTMTFVVACSSLGLLWMREQRRRATLGFLSAQGERAMLEHLTETLRETRERLASSAQVLSSALEELPRQEDAAADPMTQRMALAVERLRSVDARLAGLAGGTSRADAEVARDLASIRAGEQQFRARDTHGSVMRFAFILALACTLAAVGTPASVGLGRWFTAGCGLLGATAFAILARRRARPSEPFAVAMFLLILAPLPPLFAYLHVQWVRLDIPIPLFTGPKMVMALVPFVLPRSLWLGIAIEAVMGALCVGIYMMLNLGSLQHRIPYTEPWLTLLYCAVGVGLVVLRDQRRAASAGLLREEIEADALARRSAVLLAILDETGSPLQVLSVSLGLLARRGGAIAPHVRRMTEAVESFAEARRVLTDTPLLHTRPRLTFDAARELTRRAPQ